MPLFEGWSFNANYTLTASEVTSGAKQGQPLGSQPRHALNLGLKWQVNDKFSIPGARRIPRQAVQRHELGKEQVFYSPYWLASLGGSYAVSKNVTLSASVYNLFDKNFENYGPTKTVRQRADRRHQLVQLVPSGAGRPAPVGVGEHHVLIGTRAGPGVAGPPAGPEVSPAGRFKSRPAAARCARSIPEAAHCWPRCGPVGGHRRPRDAQAQAGAACGRARGAAVEGLEQIAQFLLRHARAAILDFHQPCAGPPAGAGGCCCLSARSAAHCAARSPRSRWLSRSPWMRRGRAVPRRCRRCGRPLQSARPRPRRPRLRPGRACRPARAGRPSSLAPAYCPPARRAVRPRVRCGPAAGPAVRAPRQFHGQLQPRQRRAQLGAMVRSSCSRVPTSACRRPAMASKSCASRPSSSLRRVSRAGVRASSWPADRPALPAAGRAPAALRVRAQHSGAVTARANSTMTSATGARPSNSQCEESKGRNSISSSRPSGSVSSCGSHQDTRTLGDARTRRGMGRAARRDSP